jgi:nitronate monooxygenase
LVTHSSNTRLAEDLSLVARFKPPVVVTALGSPKPAIEVVHAYGGLVIADVISVGLAKKAVAAGADGLACVCAGAGGHTGFLSPFAFVSAVREFFDGYVITGGGIGDGWGVAGAVAGGADLVYMGTRFIATQESNAQQEFKQMVIDSDVSDLIYTDRLSGVHANFLKPSLDKWGVDVSTLPPKSPDMSSLTDTTARLWKDLWSAGQGVATIHDAPAVATLVSRIADEYDKACRLGPSQALRRSTTAA